ncbi:MAG: hypothetical protein IPH98_18045 [Saprospiraceae bacterium]|nr:hypothetical protein [Candidatus Defluviibacterium haderslevense]
MIKNLYGAAVRGEVLNKLINSANKDYQRMLMFISQAIC